MLNRAILIGRLTKDVELRYTSSGTAVAQFTLAVERPFKSGGEKETDFLPIVVWRAQAENCAKYLSKGKLCAVEGRIQTRSYDQNGTKKYVTEIVADNVRFLESGAKKEQGEPFEDGQPVEISDDDLPFN